MDESANGLEQLFALLAVTYRPGLVDHTMGQFTRLDDHHSMPSYGLVGGLIAAGEAGLSFDEATRMVERREPEFVAACRRYSGYVSKSTRYDRAFQRTWLDAIAQVVQMDDDTHAALVAGFGGNSSVLCFVDKSTVTRLIDELTVINALTYLPWWRSPRAAEGEAPDPPATIATSETGRETPVLDSTPPGPSSPSARVTAPGRQPWRLPVALVAGAVLVVAATAVLLHRDQRGHRTGSTSTSTTPGTPGGSASTESGPINLGSGRTVTVSNKLVLGSSATYEALDPVVLSTSPENYCRPDTCAVAHTNMTTGDTLRVYCHVDGPTTTNINTSQPSDARNVARATSTLWYYGERNGTHGYLSEVWLQASDRGGLGLPTCHNS